MSMSKDTAESRAMAERLAILTGERGDGSGKALTVADLEGAVTELVLTLIDSEIKRRGLS
jgi:hypothetical protein